MEGYILRSGKEQLTLSTAAADKLLQSGQATRRSCIWRCAGSDGA